VRFCDGRLGAIGHGIGHVIGLWLGCKSLASLLAVSLPPEEIRLGNMCVHRCGLPVSKPAKNSHMHGLEGLEFLRKRRKCRSMKEKRLASNQTPQLSPKLKSPLHRTAWRGDDLEWSELFRIEIVQLAKAQRRLSTAGGRLTAHNGKRARMPIVEPSRSADAAGVSRPRVDCRRPSRPSGIGEYPDRSLASPQVDQASPRDLRPLQTE